MDHSLELLFADIPDLTATPTLDHARKVLGLHLSRSRIPVDFALWVLTNMPPSAALSGLGIISISSVAELHGYITRCNETRGHDPYLEVESYIDSKRFYHEGEMSIWWKSCAILSLIDNVRRQIYLPHLSPRPEDDLYLALRTIRLYPSLNGSNMALQPDVYGSQSPLRFQQPQQQQQQEQYMSGGNSGFAMSSSPQPSLHTNLSPHAPAGFGPVFDSAYASGCNSPVQNLSPQLLPPTPIANNLASPGTPHSAATSFIYPNSPFLAPIQANTPRSLSPLADNLSHLTVTPEDRLRRSMSPSPQSIYSATPIGTPLPTSPVPGSPHNGVNIQHQQSPHFSSIAGLMSANNSPAAAAGQAAATVQSPGPSADSLFGPSPETNPENANNCMDLTLPLRNMETGYTYGPSTSAVASGDQVMTQTLADSNREVGLSPEQLSIDYSTPASGQLADDLERVYDHLEEREMLAQLGTPSETG